MKIIIVTKEQNGVIEGYMGLPAFFRDNPEYDTDKIKGQIDNKLRERRKGKPQKDRSDKIFKDNKITLQRTEIQS